MDNKETRLPIGGIDSDSAYHLIDNNSVLNMTNARAVIHHNGKSGVVSFIEGGINTNYTNLVPAGSTLVGDCTDGVYSYFCFYHATQSTIIVVNNDTSFASVLFSTAMLASGDLGWTANSFVSCDVSDDILFIACKDQPIYYFNRTTNYGLEAPMPIDRIMLVTYPPAVPLFAYRSSSVFGSYEIQNKNMQFTYRIVNSDGFTSVLAPYSMTSLAPRSADIASNNIVGTSVDISVSTQQKFPANWKRIDFIVRYLDSNTFFCIKTYRSDISADNTAVADHNSGTTPLGFNWKGSTLYAISRNEAAKPFDSIPLSSDRLKLSHNRLFLAGNKEGYDVPNVSVSFSVTRNEFTPDYPTYLSTTLQTYLLVIRQDGTGEYYFAAFLRYNNESYLLPDPYMKGLTTDFFYSTLAIDETRTLKDQTIFFAAPININKEHLIKCNYQLTDPNPSITGWDTGGLSTAEQQARLEIVREAHKGANITPAAGFDNYGCFKYLTINILDNAPDQGNTGERRAFLPNSNYRLGIQFYDGALMKCGSKSLGEISIPNYDVADRKLTEYLKITLTGTTPALPSWVKHFSITLSKNQKTHTFIQFIPHIVLVAIKDDEGISFRGASALTSNSQNIYGIAISLKNLNLYNYGYEYKRGDYVELSYNSVVGVIRLYIKDQVGEFIITEYDPTHFTAFTTLLIPEYTTVLELNDVADPTNAVGGFISNPTPSRALTFICTLYITSETLDNELYEVAAFGSVTSGALDKFYATGNLETLIFGDCYTQTRTSATGSITCLSYTTYDRQEIEQTTDLGRITPEDTLGQKYIHSVRWSNTNIPGASSNGYASFDPGDYKVLDVSSGKVQGIASSTKGIQEGGSLVIICERNTYSTLVGKQQVVGADQNSAFTVTTASLGDINPIRGGYGCLSPRSIIEHRGHIYWVDYRNRKVVEFIPEVGIAPISDNKANNLWETILANIPYSDVGEISAGINPFSGELLISVPGNPIIPEKPSLPSTSIPNPFDPYYKYPRTYIYNIYTKRWVGSFDLFAYWHTVSGKHVYAFDKQSNRILYSFVGSPGIFDGTTSSVAIVAIPFNAEYPLTKKPISIQLVADRPPDDIYIVADNMILGTGVSTTRGWVKKEGVWYAAIGRDRLSNNASNNQQYNESSVRGARLVGTDIKVVMRWFSTSGDFKLSSVQLSYNIGKGQVS